MSQKISHSESFSKRHMRYKQTDITSFFGNSKMKKFEDKFNKSQLTSITTVVLSDSDSDFETHENVHLKKKRKKPKLPFPISDDDDSVDETSSVSQNKKVKTMMQLNKPQKSCNNKETFPAATSTPLTTNKQKGKEQTSQSIPNNSSASSDDTIILNRSNESIVGNPNILQNIVISPKDQNKENKKTIESTEEMSVSPPKKAKKDNTITELPIRQPNSFADQNLKLKVELILSFQSDDDVTNMETKINMPNKMTKSLDSNLSTLKPISSSKLTDFSTPTKSLPSTSGQSNVIHGKSSSALNAKKTLFAPSTSTQRSRNKVKLSSPKKARTKLGGNENQVTPKKKVTTTAESPTPAIQNFTSPKSDKSPLKPEEENDKLNFKQLDSIKELFKNSLEHICKRELLFATDVEIVKEFLEMDVHYQYLMMKLFLYLPRWYNLSKFCTKIKLDQKITSKEVMEMYNFLKKRKFVHTEITSLDVDVLLDMLLLGDLKRICSRFRIGKSNNKKDMIQILKKTCRTQSTLSSKKSTEDLLKEAAHECLGICVKLRDDVKISFYKAYLLQTFTNPLYIDPQKYLNDINYLNIIYPDYTVEDYFPFSYREQFTSFYKALLLKKEYFEASNKNNYVIMKNCCDTAFGRLQTISSYGKWQRHLNVYLQRFSAEHQFISILKTAARKLIRYHESIKIWLEFLVDNYPSHYALGFWYKQLAHVLVKYEKDYDSAAKVIIEGFEVNKKQEIFNSVELYELNVLATKVRTTKSYKICALFYDKLAELGELPIKSDQFPTKTISGQTDRSGKSGRRTYSFIDENNEENFGNVEMIVLNDYQKEENYEGIHCEGRLLATLFTLFFWDLIYCYYVPNTFISKFQHAPLDMYTEFFYKNRKTEIDKRLEDIAENWSSDKITEVLNENWDYHSHEESITKFNTVTTNFQELLTMFKCIDRKVFSKILKRLVTNFKTFHSGLPDLFLWNSDLSKCKFVEVKGEGDKLSHKQILWIQYLIDIGANVEVCHVSGVGSRKMKVLKE